MKKASDPRHIARRKTVQELFAYSFTGQKPKARTGKILKKKEKIDKLIEENAPAWPIAKINPVDLAILRLAIWELEFEKKNPQKVIIDEAVEIAKELGGENSPSFVNGVLGSIMEA